MTTAIIITICVLLLISYAFDLTSSKTRIPSVILLLFLGYAMQQLTVFWGLAVPDISSALPVLGTVGLILIVLEGALELELNRSKSKLITKSFFISLLPLFVLAFGMAFVFQYYAGGSLRQNLVNAIPLCVISSAIAIPSARNFDKPNREFIIYESSLSDIIGVLFFNFVALNDNFGAATFGVFSLQLLIIAVVSFVATIGLALLLSKIEHHIKFVPIILLIILIYAVSKIYHLPGLLFILFFGLFIGNLDELKHIKWIQRLHPDELDKEVHKFKDLTIEGAFLIRSIFFILFGYLIDTNELFNPDSLLWAIGITAVIFTLRYIHLKLFRLPVSPLLFMAPRGLITILLFLSIPVADNIPLVNRSLVIQVIILTAIMMMIGSFTKRSPGKNQEAIPPGEESPHKELLQH